MRLSLRCAVMALAVWAFQGCGRATVVPPVPAEPNGDCSRDLLVAFDRRDARAVKELVGRGAVANCGKTADRIMRAIREDRLDDLALLLDAGVGPDPSGHFPDHPIALAAAFEEHAFRGRGLDAALQLLKHGADPNQRGDYSWNPRTLHADDTGTPYLAYEVELRDATPLIAAAVAGKADFARLLLQSGADTAWRDSKGLTALDYVKRTGDRGMLALLAGSTTP